MSDALLSEFKREIRTLRQRPLRPYLPNFWAILLTGLAVAVACLLLIAYVDRPLALSMRAVDPRVQRFFSYVTLLGLSTPYLILSGITFILLYPASKRERWQRHAPGSRKIALSAFFIFVSIALSGLLTDALKVVFARYRPMMLYRNGHYGFIFFRLSPARVLSFPSGHANTIAALATALYFIKPRYLLLYIFVALMVMASRVVIGEHFLSDVIAGAYLGILTTCYLKAFFEFQRVELFQHGTRSGP